MQTVETGKAFLPDPTLNSFITPFEETRYDP